MMQIIECEQGSEEWHRARAGIPTASMFATVMASGRGGSDSKTRRKYMRRLAGEIYTGEVADGFSNGHMERGNAMEPEARRAYAFVADVDPTQVGFIRNGAKGASPDSLIGNNGVLEIKTKLPELLIECIEADVFPTEHRAQCQGVLWVAEREWIDIAVFWPRMPLFVKRAYRDEAFIRKLSEEVDLFNEELAAVVERVRRHGIEPARAAA